MINNKHEIYVSTDVETNGPVPGLNSMLSFGSAAFVIGGNKFEQIDTYYSNLELLQEAAVDANTAKFWDKNKEAYILTRKNIKSPVDAMKEYHDWLKKLPGIPVFVGYPATFDFMWIYYYLVRFAGNSPFSFSGMDIKTYASSIMKAPYRKSSKQHMPARWFGPTKSHTHHALEDAIEQGELFCRMWIENHQPKPPCAHSTGDTFTLV